MNIYYCQLLLILSKRDYRSGHPREWLKDAKGIWSEKTDKKMLRGNQRSCRVCIIRNFPVHSLASLLVCISTYIQHMTLFRWLQSMESKICCGKNLDNYLHSPVSECMECVSTYHSPTIHVLSPQILPFPRPLYLDKSCRRRLFHNLAQVNIRPHSQASAKIHSNRKGPSTSNPPEYSVHQYYPKDILSWTSSYHDDKPPVRTNEVFMRPI